MAAEGRVTVFAAASLRGVLDDISRQHDAPVVMSYGGSGTMARQIAAGAPADVVVLANTLWMDWLRERAMIQAGSIRYIASNRLALIALSGAAPLDHLADIPTRLGTERLAMGQRDAVPAGIYARQWLTSIGLWNHVNNQLAETDNVRAALALVARGEAPLGIVYATDAAAEPAIQVLWNIPPDPHKPILYTAAALTPSGESFLARLSSPQAQDVFAAQGFTPVPVQQ